MIAASGIASIVLFLIALWLLRLVPVASGAIATAQGAMAAMRDPALDDAAREKAVQAASLRLMGSFASIVVRGALSLGVSLLPIWLADVTGLASGAAVIDFLSRWDVIIIASVVIVAGYVVRIKLWAPTS